MNTSTKSSKKAIKLASNTYAQPVIIDRADHSLSRKRISHHAFKVLYQLLDAGFDAYLVGGCVRDILLGQKPKDFDIVTNALPEQIRSTFRNCRLIGRRFRLAHIFFGKDIVEVATFRAAQTEEDDGRLHSQHGMILRDNVYGTLEEDVWRRDFTINALYYNIADFSIVDYCNGMADLKGGLLRLIGDPAERYREDPVRILRAIRFASKLRFELHKNTAAPIPESRHLLTNISSSRLFEETLKLFLAGNSLRTFKLLQQYQLFEILFPQTSHCLSASKNSSTLALLENTFVNTDKRIAEEKSVAPAFIFAALLWHPLQKRTKKLTPEYGRESIAYEHAMSEVLTEQLKQTSIPRRITTIMREIWMLQARLIHHSPKRSLRVLQHPRFRAAYDFLLLRNESGEKLQELCDWWTARQLVEDPKIPS